MLRLRDLLAPGTVLSVLLVAAPPARAASPIVDDLNMLIAQGRFQDAYLLAQENLPENEGEPEFDFLYGLAALESGDPDEAVFAFERIAFSYPDQLRVRLELARAYFMSNNLGAAQDLFNEVLETDPEPNVAANINAFLDAIEERQSQVRSSLRWFVTSSVGGDSNINSATELGVIETPIGDIELSPSGQEIDDGFYDLGAGFTYTYPLDKNRALSLSGTYNKHDNFSTGQFDLDTLGTQGSYAATRGNHRYSGGFRLQRVLLDDSGFQTSGSLLGTWQRNGSNGWSQAFTTALTAIRYDNTATSPNNELRDVNQWLFSAILNKITGNFLHSFSAYFGTENSIRSQGKNNAQDFFGFALSQQYQFRPGHVPYIRLSLHLSDNQARDPIFNIKRDDETFSASVGWRWQFNRNLNFTADFTFTDNTSNIDLFEYDRVKYQAGLRYQF